MDRNRGFHAGISCGPRASPAGRDQVIAEAPVRRAVAAAVREALHELGPREREVVSLRFGLDGEPMTSRRFVFMTERKLRMAVRRTELGTPATQ